MARRAAEIATELARVIVVANRLRDETDFEAMRAVLRRHELVAVPEDATIAYAEREGRAPIDVDPEAPAVRALGELARRLANEG